MGFIAKPVNADAVENLTEVPGEVTADKSLWDAWWESENTLGSTMAVANDGWLRDESRDPDYDPSDDLIGTDYDTPEFHMRFSSARNQTELQRMMFHYNREQESRDRIAQATWYENLPVALATGLLDPLMAPFLAVPALRGPMLGRAVKASALGIAEATTEEVLLHPSQQTRTLGESFLNVGATAVLAGVLGPMLSKSGDIEATVKRLDDELSAPPIESRVRGGVDSAGAARFTSEETKVVGAPALRFVRKLFPSLDVALSESAVARDTGARLVEDTLVRAGHKAGKSFNDSIETIVSTEKRRVGAHLIGLLQDAYPEYRKAMKASGQKVSFEDFDRAVSLAAEYGSDDPFLEGVAAQAREVFKEYGDRGARVDLLLDEADEAIKAANKEVSRLQSRLKKVEDKLDGALDEDALKTIRRSQAQKTRQRNVLAKESRNPELIAQLDADIAALKLVKKSKKSRKALLKERDKLLSDIDAAKKAVPKKTGTAAVPKVGGAKHYLPTVYKGHEIQTRMDDWVKMGIAEAEKSGPLDAAAREEVEIYMRNAAEKIVNNYHTAATFGDMRGIKFANKRTFDISRETLRKNGFVEDSIHDLWEAYARGMVPEIIMREQGFDIGDLTKTINADYDQMIEAAAGNARRVKKLQKEKDRVVSKLKGMYEMIAGTWNLPGSAASMTGRAVVRLLMDYNIMTKLGSVTISAIPDIGHVIGRVGMRRYAKALTHLVNVSKDAKIARAQAGKWAAIYEIQLASAAKARAMIDDTLPTHQKWLRASDKATTSFIKWTGQNHWNQFQRNAHILAYTDEMLEYAAGGKWRTMSKARRAKFANSGIGDAEWERIEAMTKHVDEVHTSTGILRIANYEDWEDTAIAGKLHMVLSKEAQTGVVAPGVGDLPLMARTTGGKLVAQLKTFQFTAANRILIPTLQRAALGGAPAAAAASGFASSIAMGALVYGLKSAAYGKEVSDDPGLIIKEAIDRSGFFGIFSDANTIMDKATKGRVSATGWLSEGEMSRYYTRSVVGDILGPSLGTVDDIRRTIGMASDIAAGEKVSEGDMKAARRLIPYQNMIWLRNGLFNPIEDEMVERFAE